MNRVNLLLFATFGTLACATVASVSGLVMLFSILPSKNPQWETFYGAAIMVALSQLFCLLSKDYNRRLRDAIRREKLDELR